MKRRINITSAALAVLVCAASCQKDGSQIFTRNSREMSVTVSGGSATVKSASPLNHEKLYSMPFVTDNGDTLSLDVFISDMPEEMSSPVMTKGQIITTENIPAAYGSFMTSVFKDGEAYTDVISGNTMTDVTVTYGEGKWTFVGGPYYWPHEDDLTFCSSAPATLPDGVTSLSWNSGAKVTFDYTDTPAGAGHDAENQKDILFAIDTQNRTDHDNVAQIKFFHALTAVKFIKGDLKDCTVETVSLNNFKSNGTAEGTVSGNLLAFTWKDQDTPENYIQTYSTDVNSLAEKASLDPTANGDYTFMMIPQALDANASLDVLLRFASYSQTISVNLGSITAEQAGSEGNAARLKDWSTYAGKVITIMISMGDIDVSIDDEITDANVKQNLVIENTGGVTEYIRAVIVANWFDENGNIVAPWFDDASHTGFVDLPGAGWTLGNDGYYYYANPVAPSQRPSIPLFQTYTPPTPPVSGAHLEMKIATQAVVRDDQKKCVESAWGSTAAGYLN